MENQTVEVQNALQQAGAVAGLGLSEKTQIMLWIGIIVYVAVLIGIGMWSSRKVKGMNDFLVAGRRLPLWMATATLLATWFGAGSSMPIVTIGPATCGLVYILRNFANEKPVFMVSDFFDASNVLPSPTSLNANTANGPAFTLHAG